MNATKFEFAGPSSLCVDLGFLKVWFSYQTIVAFQPKGYPVIVRKNEWGPTTGRHLNNIPHDARDRLDGPIFRLLWQEYSDTGTIQNHPAYS